MKTSGLPGIFSCAIALALLAFTSAAQAVDKESPLHRFTVFPGAYAPVGMLLFDSAGNLYGAASLGGTSFQCCGVIFELSPGTGGPWTYDQIHVFSGGEGKPENGPYGSMVMDSAGNIYGVAGGGNAGEVFELSPGGSGTWNETILYTEPSDECCVTQAVMDSAGNLYGVVTFGANNDGYIFELSQSGGTWTFTDIFDFNGTNGSQPNGVTLDASGNLYGTTYYGGSSTNCQNGCGVVFELTKGSGGWSENVIYEFDGSNGAGPEANVTVDASGNVYASATIGGKYDFGAIVQLTPSGGGWQAHPVHDFHGYPTDGAFPSTPLTISGGNIYGTTQSGGASSGCLVGPTVSDTGCGTAFELTPSGNAWKGTLLHSFTGGPDGAFPQGLILNSSGDLFGVAIGGDIDNGGVVYELSPSSK